MNIRFFLGLCGIIILSCLIGFSWSAYRYYTAIHADDPIIPIFSIEIGTGKIIRGDIAIILSEGETYNLDNQDIVETEAATKAQITWPDRSITRLGERTRIVIKKMIVSRNYDKIQISYDMERGKVWNTVIRMLIGDSYFEARLPKQSIIAGVRGTIFEINLSSGYIHAVEHATRLSDASGKALNIIPGDIVSSENIWVKKGKEWLDTSWQEWNTLGDMTYKNIRARASESRLNTLIGDEGNFAFFDSIVRFFLKYIDGFEAVKISEYLNMNNTKKLGEYSGAELTEYYTKFVSTQSGPLKTSFQNIILEKIKNDSTMDDIRILFERANIWDSLDNNQISPYINQMLKEKDLNEQINTIQKSLDVNNLKQNLSGALRNIF